MPEAVVAYVRFVDRLNATVGKAAMWLVVLLLGVLLFAAGSKAFAHVSPIWTVETAQFTLTAYYLLGGAWTLQNGAHVRMDVFYSRWNARRRAAVDAVTILCLAAYLAVLLYGAIESAHYAFETGQKRPSAWGPLLWPIRTLMATGIFLMLLQVSAIFLRDLAVLRGRPIP